MLFAKILFTRTLSEISGRGLLRDERFGFRPKHNAVLLLARLVERVSRDFGEKRVTGAVFLDVAKTFSVAWVDGLLYKLTVLNFPSYLVKIIFPSCMIRCSKPPYNQPHTLVLTCGLAWIRVE